MTVATSSGVNIVAVCPTCQEIRYRSIRPVASKDDAVPENFAPVGEAPAVASTDTVPMCHVCAAVLTFAPAERFDRPSASAEALKRRPSEKPTIPIGEVGKRILPNSALETLFEVGQDEAVSGMRETPEGLVIVTTKRIVRIKL